jgi:homoserine O-acetyltransferase
VSPTPVRTAAAAPRLFDLRLPPLALARGGRVEPHHARGWWWGPEGDLPALEARTRLLPAPALRAPYAVVRRPEPLAAPAAGAPALDPRVPTVLLVHALTGDARAGGEGGWWEPLIGPGRPLDPARYRLLCFNNLGSCYGSSGPLEAAFPAGASLTSWDIARALLQALDVLGVQELALAAGGSLGGMVTLCLAGLAPARVQRLLPVGCAARSSAWVMGWNHVGREAIRLDPGFPDDVGRGLELARQLAMLTYRAESGLEPRHGRHRPPEAGGPGPYRIQGYLEYQGVKLRRRFDARAYLQLLDAMDHHDMLQPPPGEPGPPALARVRASALVVDVDTDILFTPEAVDALAGGLRAAGAHAERATVRSPHGHDAFLIEWEQLAPLVTRALALPEYRS